MSLSYSQCCHRRHCPAVSRFGTAARGAIGQLAIAVALYSAIGEGAIAPIAGAEAASSWFGGLWGSDAAADERPSWRRSQGNRRRVPLSEEQGHAAGHIDGGVRYADISPLARRELFASRPQRRGSTTVGAHVPSAASAAHGGSAVGAPMAEEHRQRLSLWESKASVSACWRSAVATFRHKCGGGGDGGGAASSVATDTERSMMALVLMNCQLETDGKPAHACSALSHGWWGLGGGGGGDAASPAQAQQCIGALPEALYPIYIQFRLHLDALCFYIGEEVARERMERATRDLHAAADVAYDTIGRMELRAAAVEDRMEATSLAILDRFDTQLETAQDQVSSLAAMTTSIADRHREALDATATHQGAMVQMITASTESLEGQRGVLAHILESAANLSTHTEEQHQRMALSSGEIITVLDRVYTLQQSIADSFGLVQMVGVYVVMAAAAVIVTLPHRTSTARPWCLLAIAASAYTEYYYVQGQRAEALALVRLLVSTPILRLVLPTGHGHGAGLLVDALRGDGVGGWGYIPPASPLAVVAVDVLAKLWRRSALCVVAVLCVVAAYCYESSEAQLRRIVHTALRTIASGEGRQPHGGLPSPARGPLHHAEANPPSLGIDGEEAPPQKRRRR